MDDANDDFGALFQSNPIPMWILRREDIRFLEVNNAAISTYGFSREEFLGMTIADIIPPEEVEGMRADISGMETSFGNRGTHRHQFKSGEICWAQIHAHPIIWRGQVAELVSAIDVTERVVALAELEAKEQRFRQSHVKSPFPSMIVGETGQVLSVSEALTRTTGYALQDIPHYEDWVRLAAGSDPESDSDSFQLNFATNEALQKDNLKIRCKDGSTRTWDVSSMGLGRQADGNRASIIVAFDVTDKNRAISELSQSEARFRLAVENSPFPMMIDAEDGTIIAINKVWSEITGYSHEEVPTMDAWLEKAYGDAAAPVAQLVKPRFDIESSRDYGDFTFKTKQGHFRTWRFAITNIGQLQDGRRIVLNAAHDVTEQRALEAALRASEERLLKAIEEAPYPVMIHAVGAEVIALSNSWLEGAGYTYEDMTDLHAWTDYVFGDQAAAIRKEIDDVQSGIASRQSGEFKVRTKSGEMRDWEITTVAAGKTVDGRKMAISIAYDATDRNRDSESLKLQTTALTAAANGIVITDKDGTIEWVNPAFVALTGFTAEEAMGLNPRDLVRSGLHPASFYQEMWDTILDGDVWKGELSNKKKDGSIYHEEMTITPVRSQSGEITHFVGIKQDITTRRQAERQLKLWNEELELSIKQRTIELAAATEEAERANQAKSQFLSRMSHELRTPLNSILGFAQILQLHDFGDEVKNISEPILKAGRHLLDLIDEVLDISRIEVGKLSISREAISSKRIVKDAIDLVMPMAHKAGVEVIEEHDTQAAFFIGDLRRSVQILVNLLSNAIKYNKRQGKVTLSTRREGDYVIFEVSDTGSGISESDQMRLFTPFERFGDRFVDGTGLGLSLSQKLARIMRGDLYLVESTSQGSVFAAKLPLSDRAPSVRIPSFSEDSAVSPQVFGGTVLYIEDNLENINLIEQLFKYYPEVKLYPALQGLTGLDFARLHRPDLILLDSHLPDIDGLVVLEILKAEAATKSIPVVVLTADASSEHKKEMIAAGAVSFLTKPIQLDQLMATIERILKREAR